MKLARRNKKNETETLVEIKVEPKISNGIEK